MNMINRTAVLAAWAAAASPVLAGLAAYDAKIASDNSGSLPYLAVSTSGQAFDTTNSAPFDFGAVSGSATMEFIVQGDPEAGGQNGFLAVGANDTRSLRYEQWNDTGRLGFTQNGVADYVFGLAGAPTTASPVVLTHVTYRWDQDTATMELYINGVLSGIQAGAPAFEMPSGIGLLGNNEGGVAGMSGSMERVTVYDEAVAADTILAHAEAWGGGDGSLANYDSAIADDNAGTLPYTAVSTSTLSFDTTNSEPFDFGAINGSATIEFIVVGDPVAGGTNGWLAVGANTTWSLRYEQWNDTNRLGFTHAGVLDYLFDAPPVLDTSALESPTELTHVTYRWNQDTATMELFIDGVLVGAQGATATFEMPTGMGLLGNNAAGGEGMLGVIERVTVYDDMVTDADILAHAKAWLKPADLNFAVTYDGSNLTFTWDSRFGKVYDLLSDTVLSADPSTWLVYDGHEEIGATPDQNTLMMPLPAGETERFFTLVERDAPPIFSEDFENGVGTWAIGSDGAPGTVWEVGTPSVVGPPDTNSGVACAATNLADYYAISANIWLRSPAIDLTDPAITGATLKYYQWMEVDNVDLGDHGTIRVLDATGLPGTVTELAVADADIQGSPAGWVEISVPLPAAALGNVISLEFNFVSDDYELLYAGWYIDDVEVTVK